MKKAVVTYPLAIKTDFDKLQACYVLVEQHIAESNRQAAIARANPGKYIKTGRFRAYAAESKLRLKQLLAERNRLIEKLTPPDWSEAVKSVGEEKQLALERRLFGDKRLAKNASTEAVSPLLEELKLLRLDDMPRRAFSDPTEDLTTYTEVDPGGGVQISKTADRVTVTAFQSSSLEGRLYCDKGEGHFSGNFTHRCKALLDNYQGTYAGWWFWGLSDYVDDENGLYNNDCKALFVWFWWDCDGPNVIGLEELKDVVRYRDYWYSPLLDTVYFFEIERDEGIGDYGTMYAYIATGDYYSDGGSLKDTLSRALHSKEDYRYIYAANAANYAQPGKRVWAWAELFDLSETAEPDVTTLAATDVDEDSATGNGTIEATGGENADIRGFDIGEATGEYDSEFTESGSFGLGVFSLSMTSLESGKTYYYRAKAHNSAGWGYGPEQSFTTTIVVHTFPASEIEAHSALGEGYYSGTGAPDTIGFIWGTSSGFYTEEVYEDYEAGQYFALTMTPLDPVTTYYFMAKVTHPTLGAVYGEEESFTTPADTPVVVTLSPSCPSGSTIEANGEITDIGGATPDIRGFVYDTTPHSDPGDTAPEDSDYDGHHIEETGSFSAEAYSLSMQNMPERVYYYLRAYAHNSVGYRYGAEVRLFLATDFNRLPPVGAGAETGIRFSTGSPPGMPNWYRLLDADSEFYTSDWGFGGFTGNRVYEKQHYSAPQWRRDLYEMADPCRRTGGIVKVKWIARVGHNTYPVFGGGDYRRALRTHGTVFDGDIKTSYGGDNGPGMVCELFYTNPYTGDAWTIDEVDDLQAGISLNGGSGYLRAMCDYLVIVALWVNAQVVTDTPVMYTGTTARLRGHVAEDEGDSCTTWFEYGPDTNYGSETDPQSGMHKDSQFYDDVSGLDPEVLYHYRAVLLTACGETFYGDDMTIDYDYGSMLLEQAFDQAISTVSPSWTDITFYLMELSTKRGRLHELNRVEAGTAVFNLNNATGDWWRNNTEGAFYPHIRPLTLTRLRYRYNGIYYPVWYGVSESYVPDWLEDKGGFTPIIQLSCVDVFKSFARYRLVDANPKLDGEAAAGQNVVYVENAYGLVVGQSIKIYDDDAAEINYIDAIDYDTLAVTMLYNLSYEYSGSKGYLKKFPSVPSGYRIRDILLEVQWPLALTSIDTGQVTVTEIAPAVGGVNIMEALQKTAEAEDGLLFVAADGVVTFQDSIARTVSPYNTPQATFKDDDNDSKYVKPELSDDDTFIYNEASISGPTIGEQSMLDPTSQASQGPRSIVRKESLIQNAADAAAQAFMLVERFKASKFRCQALHVFPTAAQTDLFPKVLGYDLSTRITLRLDNVRNPAILDEAYHLEGVEHSWVASNDLWQTKWQLWDAKRYQMFSAYHDGYLYNRSLVDYADCHNAAECGYAPFNDHGQLMIGQRRTSLPAWDIMRGFIELDTTNLPAAADVLEAYLLFYTTEILVDSAWSLTLVGENGVTCPLSKPDYYTIGQSGLPSKGALAMSTPPGWKVLTLNAVGIAAINKEGITRFGLRSSNDIGSIEPLNPGDNEYVMFSGIGSSEAPRLVVRLL